VIATEAIAFIGCTGIGTPNTRPGKKQPLLSSHFKAHVRRRWVPEVLHFFVVRRTLDPKTKASQVQSREPNPHQIQSSKLNSSRKLSSLS
jgi:hypothetical protein